VIASPAEPEAYTKARGSNASGLCYLVVGEARRGDAVSLPNGERPNSAPSHRARCSHIIGETLYRDVHLLETMADSDKHGNEGNGTGVAIKTKPKTKKPSMYKVLMLNDDYTPMEFVVHVLERFFAKSREEATRIMLHVHRRGVGLCGVFTYEVAETKVTQVMDYARQNQHPLQCTLEKD
jgi:ATP-dependent Clp protease adaptor protein ClpS